MGNLLGKVLLGRGRANGLRVAALAVPLVLMATACGGDGDGSLAEDLPTTASSVSETETGMLPCAEDRHLVAFDIIGFLTQENFEVLGTWNANSNIPPTARAGSIELVQAYRQQGYEILYVTTIPVGQFGEPTVEEVVTEWLQVTGYPVDGGSHVWVWDGEGRADRQTWVGIADELLRFAGEGVSIDASYTENTDKAYAFGTGGVPVDRNFTLTPIEGLGEETPSSAPTTLIPNDDLMAHAATITQLPPVCEVG